MLLLSFLLASLVYGGSATIQSPPPLSQCAAAVTVHNEVGSKVSSPRLKELRDGIAGWLQMKDKIRVGGVYYTH